MLSKAVFLLVVALASIASASQRIETPEQAIALENAKKQEEFRKGNYIRPCNLRDYHCIADNLAANSKCNKKVRGKLPQKYLVKNFRYETPYFNSSYIDNELIVRNHNRCFVSEFFFNRAGDSGVLSVDCPYLGLESTNRTLIQHYSLLEETSYNFRINGKYPLVRLTANLKHADHLDVCSAFVFGDVTALPSFEIDPLDKPTENFLSTDLTFLNIYERETFFYRAPPLFRVFVNAYICDFGCKYDFYASH